jgi:periplasmic divalent cation tolerance protein
VTALVWSTFANQTDAERAADALLTEGLIACANIFPAVRSIYRWNGERGEGTEVGALFKTDARLLDQAVARLTAIHPYDTPAVIGWRADAAAPATVAWLGALVGVAPQPD